MIPHYVYHIMRRRKVWTEISNQEQEMYELVRSYRCPRNEPALECRSTIIIGNAGVIMSCPECGWVGQKFNLAGDSEGKKDDTRPV